LSVHGKGQSVEGLVREDSGDENTGNSGSSPWKSFIDELAQRIHDVYVSHAECGRKRRKGQTYTLSLDELMKQETEVIGSNLTGFTWKGFHEIPEFVEPEQLKVQRLILHAASLARHCHIQTHAIGDFFPESPRPEQQGNDPKSGSLRCAWTQPPCSGGDK
jgi:hypothetical protein